MTTGPVSLVRLTLGGAAPRTKRKNGRRFGVRQALCLIWIIGITVIALCAAILPLPDPTIVSANANMRPFVNWAEPLGTDQLGRSLTARVLVGARASLGVAFIATMISFVIGLAIGLVVGYFGRALGATFDIVTNIMLAFPPLILLIALAAVLRPSLMTVIVSLGVLGIPIFARVSRASTLSFISREFITAAKSMGASHARVIIRELLPNVALPVLSVAMVIAASFIVAEGSISFLGLGIPPPTPSWGGMIADARDNLSRHPHLIVVPGVFFFVTVLSFNTLGEYMQSKASGKESVL